MVLKLLREKLSRKPKTPDDVVKKELKKLKPGEKEQIARDEVGFIRRREDAEEKYLLKKHKIDPQEFYERPLEEQIAVLEKLGHTELELSPEHLEALVRRNLLERVGEIRSQAGYVMRYTPKYSRAERREKEAKAKQKEIKEGLDVEEAEEIMATELSLASRKEKENILMALQSLNPQREAQVGEDPSWAERKQAGVQWIESQSKKHNIARRILERALLLRLKQGEGMAITTSKEAALKAAAEVLQLLKTLTSKEKMRLLNGFEDIESKMSSANTIKNARVRQAQQSLLRQEKEALVKTVLDKPSLTNDQYETIARHLFEQLRAEEMRRMLMESNSDMGEFFDSNLGTLFGEEEEALSPEEARKLLETVMEEEKVSSTEAA